VERQIEISGPDAFAFTNMMTPATSCAARQVKTPARHPFGHPSAHRVAEDGRGSTPSSPINPMTVARLVEIARAAGADDDVMTQVGWRRARAKVLAARDQFAEAERLSREAVEVASVGDHLDVLGDVHLELAEILRASKKPEEAVTGIREAIGYYERKGNLVSTAKAPSIS